MKLGIVLGEFHQEIAELMLADANKAAEQEGADVEVVRVPGSYETLLPTKRMLAREDIDGVVVLGFIEKGETKHGEEMGRTCSLLLKQLELNSGKPVGMGVISGATEEQALKRIKYAGNAMKAVVKMCRTSG